MEPEAPSFRTESHRINSGNITLLSASALLREAQVKRCWDLSEELPDLENAKIVWAPDSKRVAFNYSLPCKHCTYDTIAFYQLRDDKWVALRSLVDQASERTQLAQLAKEHRSEERRVGK